MEKIKKYLGEILGLVGVLVFFDGIFNRYPRLQVCYDCKYIKGLLIVEIVIGLLLIFVSGLIFLKRKK